MNIVRRLFGQKHIPNELMLLFKRSDCVLNNFCARIAHKFVQIHLNTPNIIYYAIL